MPTTTSVGTYRRNMPSLPRKCSHHAADDFPFPSTYMTTLCLFLHYAARQLLTPLTNPLHKSTISQRLRAQWAMIYSTHEMLFVQSGCKTDLSVLPWVGSFGTSHLQHNSTHFESLATIYDMTACSTP